MSGLQLSVIPPSGPAPHSQGQHLRNGKWDLNISEPHVLVDVIK